MDVGQKRLLKEARDCQKLESKEIQISPHNDNLYEWDVKLAGPPATPYEEGIFEVKLFIPSEFPMKPPSAKFITKICHPNIHLKTGEVCLDLLKNEWSPSWTLHSICLAFTVLLANPEPSSPLNCDAGNLLRCGDQRGFDSLARYYTRLYAKPRGGDQATTSTPTGSH